MLFDQVEYVGYPFLGKNSWVFYLEFVEYTFIFGKSGPGIKIERPCRIINQGRSHNGICWVADKGEHQDIGVKDDTHRERLSNAGPSFPGSSLSQFFTQFSDLFLGHLA